MRLVRMCYCCVLHDFYVLYVLSLICWNAMNGIEWNDILSKVKGTKVKQRNVKQCKEW